MLGNGLTLFIFEGENPEEPLVDSLEKSGFIDDRNKIKCVFDAEIYQLYRLLKEDDTDSLDIVKLLKRWRPSKTKALDGLSVDDFAYIYLFFDYDAHASTAEDSKIEDLLSYFNNETEHGMLYISYPMVEAIRHYKDMGSFKHLAVKCKRNNCPNLTCPDKTSCLKEPHYKNVVGKYNPQLASKHLSSKIWKLLIVAHLYKMNYIVLDVFEMPSIPQSQENIFHKQIEKYIQQSCPKVAVLSAFPLFLLDYFGCEGIKKKLAEM